MLYITLLDQFHPGIYSSQVVDVCDYLNDKHKANIRLVAFLSIKELKNTDAKLKLKQLAPNAIILPAFPKLRYFQWTAILLFLVCLFTGERVAICRNVFCTKMALPLKKFGLLKKVIFDGRSAMAAEIKEYDVFPVNYLRNNISRFEKEAVLNSDYRMAVSEALVNYWRKEYGYEGSTHVIIPCTLDTKHFNSIINFNQDELNQRKRELLVNETEILLAYAGSTAPWQSFSLMENFLNPLLEKDSRIKVLFLSKKTKDIERLQARFPGRVIQKWLEHSEVLKHLSCADYGMLLREKSTTNLVASPTKFAEYLYAGLEVLVSEQLGDFSDFVKANKCGEVVDYRTKQLLTLKKTSIKQRELNQKLATKHFCKNSEINNNQYKQLIRFITT